MLEQEVSLELVVEEMGYFGYVGNAQGIIDNLEILYKRISNMDSTERKIFFKRNSEVFDYLKPDLDYNIKNGNSIENEELDQIHGLVDKIVQEKTNSNENEGFRGTRTYVFLGEQLSKFYRFRF